MKKIGIIASALIATIAANAQGNFQSFNDREFNFDLLHTTGVLVGIFLFTSFFLSLIRLFLDSRIKNKMIEKGVSETIVEQFLQPTNRDGKSVAIKWFIISGCIGLGLAAINGLLCRSASTPSQLWHLVSHWAFLHIIFSSNVQQNNFGTSIYFQMTPIRILTTTFISIVFFASCHRGNNITISNGDDNLNISYTGDIKFNDDETAIKSISPGGYLQIHQEW